MSASLTFVSVTFIQIGIVSASRFRVLLRFEGKRNSTPVRKSIVGTAVSLRDNCAALYTIFTERYSLIINSEVTCVQHFAFRSGAHTHRRHTWTGVDVCILALSVQQKRHKAETNSQIRDTELGKNKSQYILHTHPLCTCFVDTISTIRSVSKDNGHNRNERVGWYRRPHVVRPHVVRPL